MTPSSHTAFLPASTRLVVAERRHQHHLVAVAGSHQRRERGAEQNAGRAAKPVRDVDCCSPVVHVQDLPVDRPAATLPIRAATTRECVITTWSLRTTHGSG